MRVVTPDVGGGFGTKLFPYREYALAAVAAQRLGRPVKWIADRSEHFLGDAQGRDNVTTAKLALDERRPLSRARRRPRSPTWAPISPAMRRSFPIIGAGMSPGVYDIPACHVRVRGVYTNTVPVDAYRGAGRPEAAYVIERLVDVAARELGVAPDALRRKNFIKATPYTTATGKTYDSGDFAGHLARAQEIADWNGFERRLAQLAQARAAARHRPRDLYRGLRQQWPRHRARPPRPGWRRHRAHRDRSRPGRATPPPMRRSSPITSGLPPERVRVVQGDTDLIATGTGTGGSSSIPCGGASVAGAAEQARRQAQGHRRRRARSGARAISRSPTARCASPAPTGRSRSPISPAVRRREGARSRRKTPSRRRRRPIPTAPISPRSRSIPRPARRASSTTSWSTISA